MNYSPFDGNPSSGSSEDCELLENVSFTVKSPPRNTTGTIYRISRTVKSVLQDKTEVEQLIR